MKKPDLQNSIVGNHDLLNTNTGLILNSRQSKTPCGADGWVPATINAVKYLIDSNLTIITSIGMNTWELVLWAAGTMSGRCIILVPGGDHEKYLGKCSSITRNFVLTSDNFLLMPVVFESTGQSAKKWWNERDKLAFDMAYEIIPVSVKESGRWSSTLKSPLITDKKVNDQFRVRYASRGKASNLAIEIPECGIKNDWDYVTHWTKRSYNAFPSEKESSYYEAIAASEDWYPRDAESALLNIIRTGKIYGSSRNIRGGKSAVSFTGLTPSEAVKLMKWHKRKVCYTFEPYGIAIKSHAAHDAGIQPVHYVLGGRNTDTGGSDTLSEFTQGYSKGEWWREDELRYIGDLDLNSFNPDDIRILVPNEEVLRRIDKESQYRVISMTEDGKGDRHLFRSHYY